MSGLLLTDSIKGQKKKKGKGDKKTKVDPKGICNYYKESGHWKRDCPKEAKKDFLFKMTPQRKMVWF